MPRFFYALEHEQFQPEILVRHAKLAEEVGFDGCFVSEHFHPWTDDGAAGFAFSTLGAIAATTKNLVLMAGVTTPLFRYHPGVVAQAAATLDRISGGRFELGVGTGEKINEGPLGFEFPRYKERAERMIEALEVISKLFSGEKLTFDGKYYKTDRAKLYSPPTRKMPIFMAASGPKSAFLAAKYTDGIIVSVEKPQETLMNVIDPAKKVAQEVGKPMPKIIASRWTVFAQNKDEAWGAIKPWRGLRAPGRDQAVDPQDLRKKADGMSREEILNKFALVSTPEGFIRSYTPLTKELKADTVVIQTTSINQEKTIKLLGEKILPTLKNL